MESETGSIYELLEIIKQLKQQGSQNQPKLKDLSSLSFSDKYDSNNPMLSSKMKPSSRIDMQGLSDQKPSKKNIDQSNISNNSNIFYKLYNEGKEMGMRKCRLEYETRRSKQKKQQQQCTFSPNLKVRSHIRTEYDSMEQNESFYLKNMEWLQRKQRSIKIKQCQQNVENVTQLTFTPKINKSYKKKDQNKQNQVIRNKGVGDFLSRQQKAKKMQQQVKQRRKNPYSHIWTVKKGHFSYLK